MKTQNISLKKALPLLLFFGVGVLGGIAGTIIVSAHGGDASKIHACVGTGLLNTGQIRIVGASDTCNSNEDPLDWNIQGPTGVPGENAEIPFTCTNCDFASNNSSLQLANGQFENANLMKSVFSQSNIANTNFTNALLGGAEFIQTTFSNINFTDADLRYAYFEDNNLDTVDFTNANLEGAEGMGSATMDSITWSNTTCPDGTNSDNNSNTCVGHLVP